MNILYAISTKSNLERKTFCVKIAVDLFVRSWVEIFGKNLVLPPLSRPLREVVSWNVICPKQAREVNCRPLREVVSWNAIRSIPEGAKSLSTSSWGRELKYIFQSIAVIRHRRPLREVVSWNIPICLSPLIHCCRPLREVVSWNTFQRLSSWCSHVDLFVRSWVEIWCFECLISVFPVDLFVRSWVEIFKFLLDVA